MFHRATEFASAPIGQASAETASPQQAAHVIEYGCWAALKHLRNIGACDRKASRKLNDNEFDDNYESVRNGEGEIY